MSAGHGGGRRRKKAAHEEEHENHERWAVSYADMMTVLLGLFIVLYAISQVDQAKFEQLRQSLAAGFGNPAPSMMIGSTGAMAGVDDFEITPDLVGDTGLDSSQMLTPESLLVGTGDDPEGGADPTGASDTELTTEDAKNLALAQAEYDRLDAIAAQVAGALDQQGLGDRVRLRITERGLLIGLVADDVFFSADAAVLTATALSVIDTVTPVLVGITDDISVEGHANVLPTAAYPTNWELSSDRATQVVRRMVEFSGLPGNRVAAVGFGDARPLDNAFDNLEGNRRVDVVVLSGVDEDIRVLLPAIAAAKER